MNEQNDDFRDPTTLTKWTKGMLYAFVAVMLVAVWTHAGELLGRGGPESLAGLLAGIPLLDSLGRLIGSVWEIVAEIAASLITAILLLVWIYRANYNARALGAADMAFTPGWAVRWYFIPIAWFWKPYQAMREIWQASVSPADWKQQVGSPLLLWWWVLWILSTWVWFPVQEVALRNLPAAEARIAETTIELAWAILDIPLALILIAIIGGVHRMQMNHVGRSEAPGRCA